MNGSLVWRRWGQWAAHVFIDGKQACKTPHRHVKYHTKSGEPWQLSDDLPPLCEVTPHGQPYGRVCPRCLKLIVAKTKSSLPHVTGDRGPHVLK